MTTQTPQKQEFRIRDLGTRSVLLFPTRAQIIRDIKDITIHPGANQIIIDGLAPTIDEHSVKVEGSGAATITDVSVNLLPNRELYEDVYPSDGEDEDEEESKSESGPKGVKSIEDSIRGLGVRLLAESEKINSAVFRLKVIDTYVTVTASSSEKTTVDMVKLVNEYGQERQKVYHDHEAGTLAAESIRSQIRAAEEEKAKLVKSWTKSTEKKEKERAKLTEKRFRDRAERRKEKQRVRNERLSFWAKNVYRVTINLEPASDTPSSSRRSSTSEIVTPSHTNLVTSTFHETTEKPLPKDKINLSISYITYSASWSPRYDLSLNTVKCTGLLEYGAELRNTTSETWKDAKFILSTSQTTFSGLSEDIPTLEPWQVCLQKGAGKDGGLMSTNEVIAKRDEWNKTVFNTNEKPRWVDFGASESDTTLARYQETQQGHILAQQRHREKLMQDFHAGQKEASADTKKNTAFSSFGAPAAAPVANPLFGAALAQSSQGRASGTSLFGSARATADLAPESAKIGALSGFGSTGPAGSSPFGAVINATATNPFGKATSQSFGGNSVSSLFGNMATKPAGVAAKRPAPEEEVLNDFDFDSFTGPVDFNFDGSMEPVPQDSLNFEAGTWEETGLTTTYDLPSTKTLSPSPTASKHKIAKSPFSDIHFSHILFPKLRAVAFLKAHLRNTSKITLLKGPLGLSLDNSFLGQTTFPRCSAGESFSLPLGVDPTLLVSYGKPVVRRSQSGIFSKEDSNLFTRTITIQNTKHNSMPVDVTVLDQIPVSEDERLKIEVVNPAGLKVGGAAVKTGVDALVNGSRLGSTGGERSGTAAYERERYGGAGAKEKEKWGTALATAKKLGEISWSVMLNPGQGVKLVLEYEATFPAGEGVVGR
ncbi:hypothetical protein HYALB_00009802 [Hymenoscyphus albidus]|uniref:DUF4139 domain-containing protein n=1 Tax=Hymenoscyphus albidus TaxID=595503 RepID=A0A9N9Q067_9HELO|nr:hypothetical protein HYALB_00009802 [Hymenoscyphus albidus]